jgi:hypothetical protein
VRESTIYNCNCSCCSLLVRLSLQQGKHSAPPPAPASAHPVDVARSRDCRALAAVVGPYRRTTGRRRRPGRRPGSLRPADTRGTDDDAAADSQELTEHLPPTHRLDGRGGALQHAGALPVSR